MEAVDITKQKTAANEKSVFCEKPVYDHFKRLFDIVCSLLAMIVLSPLLIITAIAIMAEDFGNPFFIQERIGQNGKAFKMIKFRSMHLNAESELEPLLPQNEYQSVHFKMENDPRITKVGRLIRPVSIDELPQLINVLMGDMSIIGPRPFIASEQEQLPDDRLFVKPGLSCYWQIANTTKMSSEEQLELDYRYIRERSFPTDIKIILKTIVVVFRGKNS